MRIGVIHWGFPPRAGGVETHLATLYPKLARMGHRVFVLTETMAGLSQEQDFHGVKIIRRKELCCANLDRWSQTEQNLYTKVEPTLKGFLSKHKISILHAHNIHLDYFVFAQTLIDIAQKKKIPCIAFLHNHIFIDRNLQTTKRIITKLPWTKLICVSQFIKEQVLSSTKIDKGKLKVVLHGIDLKRFSPANTQEKVQIKERYGFSRRRIILHPARILPWKGIIPAIRAMPKIIKRFPQSLMVLTGRIKALHKDQVEVARYNNLVDATIKRLNLKDYIRMGRYTYNDIPAVTKVADVLIYTTIKDEPFGLCPVEAMASSVPAIVTKSGGLKESVVQDKTGFIIGKDQKELPNQLAAKVIKLFSEPGLCKKMGRAGRQRVQGYFSLQTMADSLINISQRLLKQ